MGMKSEPPSSVFAPNSIVAYNESSMKHFKVGAKELWGAHQKLVSVTYALRCRVFVLLSALSQKALTGPSSVHILDSLLSMLTSVLQPLTANQGMPTQATGCLDLGLVSWILLFLCRNLDSALSPGASDESDKGSKREREGEGVGSLFVWACRWCLLFLNGQLLWHGKKE